MNKIVIQYETHKVLTQKQFNWNETPTWENRNDPLSNDTQPNTTQPNNAEQTLTQEQK